MAGLLPFVTVPSSVWPLPLLKGVCQLGYSGVIRQTEAAAYGQGVPLLRGASACKSCYALDSSTMGTPGEPPENLIGGGHCSGLTRGNTKLH